jgi:hypothetical protein
MALVLRERIGRTCAIHGRQKALSNPDLAPPNELPTLLLSREAAMLKHGQIVLSQGAGGYP